MARVRPIIHHEYPGSECTSDVLEKPVAEGNKTENKTENFREYKLKIYSDESVMIRQWPEVYDLCHTFWHVARVKKTTATRESHVFRVRFSHGRVFETRSILAWP